MEQPDPSPGLSAETKACRPLAVFQPTKSETALTAGWLINLIQCRSTPLLGG
jgi:hypothetical protein